MDHTHSDLEASALLTGSGACVIYLRELHIHSVTLMPALRSRYELYLRVGTRRDFETGPFFLLFPLFFFFSRKKSSLDDRQTIQPSGKIVSIVWKGSINPILIFFAMLFDLSLGEIVSWNISRTVAWIMPFFSSARRSLFNSDMEKRMEWTWW